MKILHIAQDRRAALVAARVVHGIAQNVTLTWVPTPAAALEWLQRQPRHRGCHRRGAGAELRLVRRAASRTRVDDAGRGRRGIRATRTGARRAQFRRRRIRGGRPVARGRPASNRDRRHRTRAQPPATRHADTDRARRRARTGRAAARSRRRGTPADRTAQRIRTGRSRGAARRRSGPALGDPGARDQDLHGAAAATLRARE